MKIATDTTNKIILKTQRKKNHKLFQIYSINLGLIQKFNLLQQNY